MYAVQGESWIAMGGPVGPESEHEEIVWKFRELCESHKDWPVFYQVYKDQLSLFIDCGLTLTKLGEEGRVPLENFSS